MLEQLETYHRAGKTGMPADLVKFYQDELTKYRRFQDQEGETLFPKWEAERKEARFQHTAGMFGGLEKMRETIEAAHGRELLDELDRQAVHAENSDTWFRRQANLGFIEDAAGGEIGLEYEALRDRMAADLFGKPDGVTDDEFYGLVQADMKTRTDERAMLGEMVTRTGDFVLDTAHLRSRWLETNDADGPGEIEQWSTEEVGESAWRVWFDENRGRPEFDESKLSSYREMFRASFASMRNNMGEEAFLARQAFEFAASEEDVPHANLVSQGDPSEIETAIVELGDIGSEGMNKFMAAMEYYAEREGMSIQGFWKKWGASFGRGWRQYGTSLETYARGQNAEHMERQADKEFMVVPAGMAWEDMAEVAAMGRFVGVDEKKHELTDEHPQRWATKEEQREIRKWTTLYRRQVDLVRYIEKGVKPQSLKRIRPTMEAGTLHDMEQGLFDATQSLPYMAMAATRLGAIPNAVVMAEDNYGELLRQYPDIDRKIARRISDTAAVPQALIERLQYKTLFGRWKNTRGFFARLEHGGFLRKMAARTFLEFSQETAQDAMLPIVQDLAEKLSADVPDVDWSGELNRLWDESPRRFWAVVPYGILGAAGSTAHERFQSHSMKALLSDTDRMQLAGLTGPEAEAVAHLAKTSNVKAVRKFKQFYGSKSPDERRSTARAVPEEVLERILEPAIEEAVTQAEAAGVIPTVRELDDGTFEVEYPGLDAQPAEVVENEEEAQSRVIEWAQQHGETNALIISEMMEHFRGYHGNQTFDYQPNKGLTLQDAVDRGRSTVDDAWERVRILHSMRGEVVPDSASLEDYRTLGSVEVRVRAGVAEAVIALGKGANPMTVVEEAAEGYLRTMYAAGRLSAQDMRVMLEEFQESSGHDLGVSESDQSVTEAFSHLVQAYAIGEVRNEQLPQGFRRFVEAFQEILAATFKLAADLVGLEVEGKLEGDLRNHVRRAAGLDQEFLEARMLEETRQEILEEVHDPETELSVLLRGKLPRPSAYDDQVAEDQSGMGAMFRGELQAIWDAMTRETQRRRRDGRRAMTSQKANVFFANKDEGKPLAMLDAALEAAQEAGFEFDSISEMLDAVLESIEGRKQFPTYGESSSFSVAGPRQEPIDVQGVAWVQPERAAGESVVIIDLARFDEAWAKDKGFYIGRGGEGGIGTRYQKFGEFIEKGEPVEMAEVGLRNGIPGFTNGRHRVAWMRDRGFTRIPVSVEGVQEAAQMEQLFGAGELVDHGQSFSIARVGTAKLGSKEVRKATPQSSNISGELVPPEALANQFERIDHRRQGWKPGKGGRGRKKYPKAYEHVPAEVLEGDPAQRREKYIRWMADNLVALHEAFDPTWRERATHWYEGANVIARRLGAQHGVSPEQAAGVLAVLSPQKDWFKNVAQAGQVLDVWFNHRRKKIRGENVEQAIADIVGAAEGRKEKRIRQALFDSFRGRTIAAIAKENSRRGAWAIRLMAQAIHGREYHVISPEGEQMWTATTKSGKTADNGWGSTSEIQKAIAILEDGDVENISEQMGEYHKVRSFYNNIVDPQSLEGDVTIDTHAVSAAHLMPFGASAWEVKEGLGEGPGSATNGVNGQYHLYADAYRLAAEELGLLPRQLQSITWEAVRGLYLPADRRNQGFVDQRRADWQNSEDEATARSRLLDRGIQAPFWVGSGAARPATGGQKVLGKGGRRGADLGRGGPAGVRPGRTRGAPTGGPRGVVEGQNYGITWSLAFGKDPDALVAAINRKIRPPDERTAVYERMLRRLELVRGRTRTTRAKGRRSVLNINEEERADITTAILELDAIVGALPQEIRGKFRTGAAAKLAQLTTAKGRVNYLARRIEEVDEVLSEHIRTHYLNRTAELIDRTRADSKKGNLRGRLTGPIHSELEKIELILMMGPDEFADAVDKAERSMTSAEDSDANEDAAEDLFRLMHYGDLETKDAAAARTAYENVETLVRAGRTRFRMKIEAEREHRKKWRGVVMDNVTGGKGPKTSARAKREEPGALPDKPTVVDRLRAVGERVADTAKSIHLVQQSWEWLLNAATRADKDTGTLGSETVKRYSRMAHEATMTERLQLQARQEEASRIFAEVFGVDSSKAGWRMRLSDELYEFQRERNDTGVLRFEHGRKEKGRIEIEKAAQLLIDKTVTAEGLGLTMPEFIAIRDAFQAQVLETPIDEVAGQKAYDQVIAKYEGKTRTSKDPEQIHEEAETARRKARLGRVPTQKRFLEYDYQGFEGTEVQQRLSQDQALYLSMLWRQEGYREVMEYHGWSGQSMEALEAFLSDEALALREWLDVQYENNYHELNRVYEQLYGVNMPRIKHYAPARFDHGKQKEDNLIDNGAGLTTLSPGFTKSRVNHLAPPRQDVGALTIFLQHTAQSEHFKAWSHPVREMRAVFSHRETQEVLRQFGGRKLNDLVQTRIDWFADGGNRKAEVVGWIDHLRRNFTITALSYNWGVMLKQLTSFPAYMFDIPIAKFLKYEAELLTSPHKSWDLIWNKIRQLPYVQSRFKGGYERDVMAVLQHTGGKGKKGRLAKAAEWGMISGRLGDIFPVIVGGYAAYRHAWDQAKARNATDATAESEAVLALEMASDRAQQAGATKDLSTMQGGGSVNRLFTMFLTSPRQYYSNVYESLLDWKAGRKGAGREFTRRLVVGHVMLPLAFQFVTDAVRNLIRPDDEEEWDPADYWRAMALGPLNGMFLIGHGLVELTSAATGSRSYGYSMPVLEAFNDFAGGAKKAVQYASDEDERSTKKILEIVHEIGQGLSKVAGGGALWYDIGGKIIRRTPGGSEFIGDMLESEDSLSMQEARERDRVYSEEQKARREVEGPKPGEIELTKEERQIKSLGVKSGARAAYIQDKGRRMSKDDREAWYADLRQKRILTPAVEGMMSPDE